MFSSVLCREWEGAFEDYVQVGSDEFKRVK